MITANRGGRHKAATRRSGRRRLTIVAAGTTAAVLAGGGAAFAYWTTAGSGSGAAQASAMQLPGVVDTNATVQGTLLYPGLAADGANTGGTLVVMATNPNPFPVTITLEQNGPATADESGCNTTGVIFRGGSITVPKSQNEPVERTVPKSVGMLPTSDSACQDATFSVPLKTTSSSN